MEKYYDRGGNEFYFAVTKEDIAEARSCNLNFFTVRNEQPEVFRNGVPSKTRVFKKSFGNMADGDLVPLIAGAKTIAKMKRSQAPYITITDGKPEIGHSLSGRVDNQYIRDEHGIGYYIIGSDEVEAAVEEGINFLSVRNGTEMFAVANGKEVPVPEVHINERGVSYHVVDIVKEAEKVASGEGKIIGRKLDRVKVYINSQAGESVSSILFGVREHGRVLQEGEFKVVNMTTREEYSFTWNYLMENYHIEMNSCDEEGEFLVCFSKKETEWVHIRKNVCFVCWGGLMYLVTPMVNITNWDDVYGCNYQIWYGSDVVPASYKFVRFEPAGVTPEFAEVIAGKARELVFKLLTVPKSQWAGLITGAQK